MDSQDYTDKEIEEGIEILGSSSEDNQVPSSSKGKPPLKWGLIIPLIFFGLIVGSIAFGEIFDIPLITDTFYLFVDSFSSKQTIPISIEVNDRHGAYYDDIDLPDKEQGIDTRILIISSSVKNVYEDNQWKRIEDARSLKESGIEFGSLKTDSRYGYEIVDFNYTSITFIPILNDNKDLDKNVSIKKDEVVKGKFNYKSVNDRKSVTFYGDILNSNFTVGDNSTSFSVNGTGNNGRLFPTSTERGATAFTNFPYVTMGTDSIAGYVSRLVLNFSLVALPQGSTVISANLSVYKTTDFSDLTGNFTYTVKNGTFDKVDSNAPANFTGWVAGASSLYGGANVTYTYDTGTNNIMANSYFNTSFNSDGLSLITERAGKELKLMMLSQFDLDGGTMGGSLRRALDLGNPLSQAPLLFITYNAPATNTAPNFTQGYPQINSTDGQNTSLKNLTAVWQGTDVDIANILKYNITWFTNNVTNFTLRNIAYTNGTLQVDILEQRNLTNTVGKTWKAQIDLCDNASACVYGNTSELLIINVPIVPPTLNLPPDAITTANYSINMSCYGSQDPNTLSTDMNYEFYLQRETTPPTILFGNTTAQSNITNLGIDGTYYWRCRTNNNATVSSYSSTRSFIVDRRLILSNLTLTNSSAIYSSKQSIGLNITINPQTARSVNATLVYNGNSYPITTASSGTNYIFSSSGISIDSTISRFFNWTIISVYNNGTMAFPINTSFVGNQSITDDNFALCNSSLTSPVFLNITFQDEVSSKQINASIESSTFGFYVDDGSLSKSLSFINQTANYEYDFCGVPRDTYLNSNITAFTYKQGTAYPQRSYAENLLLVNGTINKTLQLLASSEGSYTTFQVLTIANSPIENVLITAEKKVGSSFVLVESKTTDASGGATFFVNPNSLYRFTFTKSGYTTFTTTLNPTQTTYTVTLSTTTIGDVVNVNRGMDYQIAPQGVLKNNTNYSFSFNIQSNYWTLTEYGFILTNGSGIAGNLISGGNAKGTTGTGSNLSVNVNTANNSNIVMNYYWIINSTYANGTKTWNVFQTYQGAYSILTVCQDIKQFSRNGFNDFSRGIIAVFLIAMITVIASASMGSFISVNYISVAGIIFFTTAFFDYCGGLIPTPIGAIEHFTTLLIFVIFAGLVLQEYIANR